MLTLRTVQSRSGEKISVQREGSVSGSVKRMEWWHLGIMGALGTGDGFSAIVYRAS